MTFKVILRKDVIYKNNTSPLCLLFFHDNRKKIGWLRRFRSP